MEHVQAAATQCVVAVEAEREASHAHVRTRATWYTPIAPTTAPYNITECI